MFLRLSRLLIGADCAWSDGEVARELAAVRGILTFALGWFYMTKKTVGCGQRHLFEQVGLCYLNIWIWANNQTIVCVIIAEAIYSRSSNDRAPQEAGWLIAFMHTEWWDIAEGK